VASYGDGKVYKRWYYWEIVLSRATAALGSPQLTYLQRHVVLLAFSPAILLVTVLIRRMYLAKLVIWLGLAYLFYSLRPLLPFMFDPQQEDFNPSDHLLLTAVFALEYANLTPNPAQPPTHNPKHQTSELRLLVYSPA